MNEIPADFGIHSKFKESLNALADEEQDVVRSFLSTLKRGGKITPGMRGHWVGQFFSLSPNMDLRVLATWTGNTCTLVYVDHHDSAYEWAERTAFLDVPGSDATELLDLSELDLPAEDTGPGLPVPVKAILDIPDDEAFLSAISGLSPEWQDWMFEAYASDREDLNTAPLGSSLVHVPTDDEALQNALDLDLPDWRLFLHPKQEAAATDTSGQLITVSGGPGTGKTVVLLNRLLNLSPKKEKNGCSVLVTYSRGLAQYILGTIEKKESRLYYVCSSKLIDEIGSPEKSIHQHGGDRVRLEMDPEDGLMVRHHRHRIIPVSELLIDELQDTTESSIRTIEKVLDTGSTRVVAAGDSGQSIFRAKNKPAIRRLLNRSDSHYHLTYSYRSTHQIIEKAVAWSAEHGMERKAPSAIGLSGPDVRFISSIDLRDQVHTCTDVVEDLRKRYDTDELALIYCQYPNPSFNGKSIEEDELKGHPKLRRIYRFASVTKGKEYKAGVIFISKTFMGKDMGERGNALRANILYVALTRFRDEVTVVYPIDCAVRKKLAAITE